MLPYMAKGIQIAVETKIGKSTELSDRKITWIIQVGPI